MDFLLPNFLDFSVGFEIVLPLLFLKIIALILVVKFSAVIKFQIVLDIRGAGLLQCWRPSDRDADVSFTDFVVNLLLGFPTIDFFYLRYWLPLVSSESPDLGDLLLDHLSFSH